MTRIYFFILGFLFLLSACNNDLKTIGQDMINNGNYIGEEDLNIENVATVKLDSFVTSCGINTTQYINNQYINKMIMGRYTDEYSGTTEAIPCFQVAPSARPSISTDAVLDSVTLQFSYGGSLWGDTLYNLRIQKYNLYQLKNLPKLDYDDYGYFYNTSKVDTARIIGTSQFLPRIDNMKWAYFKIEDALGEDLFEKMRYRDDEDIYQTNSSSIPFLNFLLYFKGLAIVPDPGNDCLISIDARSDSLYMQFHYHEGATARSIKFPLSQREYQYNAITNDPTPRFSSLTTQSQEVSFDDAGIAISQGLAGYLAKLVLPNPPQFSSYTTIIKAQMEIKPEYINNNPIAYPAEITVYTCNDLNEVTGKLVNNPTPTSLTYVTGKLEVDNQNPDNTRYIFDMTEYYQNMLSVSPSKKEQQVLLSIPDITLSYDCMVVREKPIIRFYYAKYK